jgi:hypothetical protein
MTNFGAQPALAAALWSGTTPLAARFLCLAYRVMPSRRDTHKYMEDDDDRAVRLSHLFGSCIFDDSEYRFRRTFDASRSTQQA